jgi:predicted amidohydrolase YtcJ
MEAAGWTQVQIAGASPTEYERIAKLQGEGKIKLRVYGAIGGGKAAGKLLEEGPPIGGHGHGHRLTVRSIKMMIDGALGSRGAALLEPYADAGDTGLLLGSPESMMPILEKALRSGIQIETHAIGDRGNRVVLDLYEKAFAAVPVAERRVAEPRWRIEHAQIIHPDDIGRFAKLGVIASMQPSHAIGDLHFAPARLGLPRLQGAYAWQRLVDAGAIIAGGSDVPVEKGDPLIEFYAAVSRKDTEGRSGAGWHPELAVSRETALKMFTSWAAYAAFEEKDRGTLEPGKLADMTVFSGDIMTIPEKEILAAHCTMTIVGGQVIYEKGRDTAGTNAP